MYCICVNQCLTSCSGCFLLVTLSFSVIPVFQGLNFWCFFFSLKKKQNSYCIFFNCHILIRDKHYNLNTEGSCSNRVSFVKYIPPPSLLYSVITEGLCNSSGRIDKVVNLQETTCTTQMIVTTIAFQVKSHTHTKDL